MSITSAVVLWQVNSMDKLEAILKMLFGKNLEQVEYALHGDGRKGGWVYQHQRVNFISQKVDPEQTNVQCFHRIKKQTDKKIC